MFEGIYDFPLVNHIFLELALQELNLKMAAGSHVAITKPVLLASLAASVGMLLAGLW